uniref:MAPK regulated corepressor interacting protein 2 n=1 Tax=Oncorhynchus tshawytscha TaxID=74940 RepID=A0AAZ3R9F2_ONCTS
MMYTITRGPSKLVTQRRTGVTQYDFTHSYSFTVIFYLSSSPTPKIVFNRLNGKRYHTAASQKEDTTSEGFTPAHEENVRFVYEAWQEIKQQLAGDGEGRVEPAAVCGQGPVQYAEKTPSTTTKSE